MQDSKSMAYTITDLPQLLTTAEAAQILRVTPKHVRSLLSKGELAGCRVGGVWRVSRDNLLRLAGLAD